MMWRSGLSQSGEPVQPSSGTTQSFGCHPMVARHNIPAVYPLAVFPGEGGLMSYGPDSVALYRRLASDYVGRLLRGAKPADLPVQQPTQFDLIINLKTAKALGL